jgi:hypothetical protein
MSQPPPYKEVPRENLPGSPNWVENLLSPINLDLRAIYYGWTTMNYPDNFDCQIQNFSLIAGATDADNTYKFLLSRTQEPAEVRIRKVSQFDGKGDSFTTGIKFHYSNGTVFITSISGLTPGIRYNVSVIAHYK